ncbi:MAG: imidazole glycerol phosphate synthase subunit HisH [Clostridiales bacterium]|nr:MAG: imidazole glycerol phosphate synthase subunit HisH [Clostridiales bacterium]
MTGIIDYGVGNLFSLRSSLEAIGEQAVVSGDPALLHQADRLVLPGVGAFGDAAEKLRASGLDQLIRAEAAAGKPLLGICLGMQLLFEQSLEYGVHQGLGLLEGSVVPMEGVLPAELKIPHIGWNALHLVQKDCPLFAGIREGDYVYFVHSYYAENCGGALAATAEYGIPLTAAVAGGSVYGCQFHPEKSGRVGLEILRAFSRLKGD